jgi:H+-transporting ATPase
VGNLTIAGVFMGLSELVFCAAVLAAGKYRLGLGLGGLRSLCFLALVFANQATTYVNRTRGHLWSIRPSRLLVLSSAADLLIAATLANRGIAMASLPLPVLGAVLAGAAVFALLVDQVKVPVLKRLRIA